LLNGNVHERDLEIFQSANILIVDFSCGYFNKDISCVVDNFGNATSLFFDQPYRKLMVKWRFSSVLYK
jgi:hypothetical protein